MTEAVDCAVGGAERTGRAGVLAPAAPPVFDGPLYAPRTKIYPAAVRGRFRSIKWAVLGLLLAIYYLTPWLRWDRGPGVPDQAVLLDVAQRRAFLLGFEIWPQQLYLLTGLLVLGALALFLATALFGRVWCGFTCPQTVWTDLFLAIERGIQGDRNARLRLDRQPWTADKLLRKGATHAAWLAVAFLTGGVWITYFTDAPTVTAHFFTGEASAATYVFTALFTATTYVLGGLAREQVCIYMCPWPRFQAALTDEHSLVVTYQSWRGEPRGKHKAGLSWAGRGDCVDCQACLHACPTGVDIRDGYQLGCIGCGLCIDACDGIMTRVDRPRGLITLDSELGQRARAAGLPQARALLRPRTLAYAGAIAALGLVMLIALSARATAELRVIHERAPLFVELANGEIRNGYTLKVENRSRMARHYRLAITGPERLSTGIVGLEGHAQSAVLALRPNATQSWRLYVTLPDAVAAKAGEVVFTLRESSADGTPLDAGETLAAAAPFMSPGGR